MSLVKWEVLSDWKVMIKARGKFSLLFWVSLWPLDLFWTLHIIYSIFLSNLYRSEKYSQKKMFTGLQTYSDFPLMIIFGLSADFISFESIQFWMTAQASKFSWFFFLLQDYRVWCNRYSIVILRLMFHHLLSPSCVANCSAIQTYLGVNLVECSSTPEETHLGLWC